MATVRDLLNLALFDAGIIGQGQQANQPDINFAFIRLNAMLDEWALQRWLVWHTVDVSKVSTGAQSYTVGPTGDFNVTFAPDRLEAAFFRQLVQSSPNQIDYPLRVLQAREDYNNIALKQLASFPTCIFYDPGVPLGTIFPWPVPQASIYEIHLTLKAVLNEFVTVNDVISLPREYFNAMHWNMAVRLRTAYDLPPKPADVMLAKKALSVIRGANAQIATLVFPQDLIRPRIYDPYSDQIR
jgi:hypothetical protein